MTRLEQAAALNITRDESDECFHSFAWDIPESSGGKNYGGSWRWDHQYLGFMETRNGQQYCFHMAPIAQAQAVLTAIRNNAKTMAAVAQMTKDLVKSHALYRDNTIAEIFNATQKGDSTEQQ